VLESPTVAELGEAIEALLPEDAPALHGPREEAPTLVEIQAGDPARLPFFTVHAAGGNVLSYYNLARRLGRERPVYALQAPGLEGEGQLFERIEDLAAHHVEAVRTAQPHGPYLVGGWSAGGAIAFEMAQQLRRAGEEVLLVALLDTYSPKSGELLDDVRMLLWQAVRYQVPVTLDELTPYATYEERVDHLIARARAAGILPPEVDEVQAQRMVATELRILRAILNYRPAVLDARLVYFRCLEGADIGADYEELFPHVNQLDHPAAWRELSTEPMAVYDVPGEHAAMMEEPNVNVLAEHLAAVLAQVEAAATVGKGEP
jgi:thioesterase domain-containing protein